MNYSSITQIAFLIIAIALSATFTRPTLLSIKALQDEIFIYADAKDKASEFNAKLESVLSQAQAFQGSDLRALETYLPTSIDTLAVMSDIEVIARKNNLLVSQLSAGPEEEEQEGVVFESYDESGEAIPIINTTDSKEFTLVVTGEYEDFKAMLQDLEINKYPLDVVKLQIGATSVSQDVEVSEAGMTDATYSMTLRTYAYEYVGIQSPSNGVSDDGSEVTF
jgi:hypothetical protein